MVRWENVSGALRQIVILRAVNVRLGIVCTEQMCRLSNLYPEGGAYAKANSSTWKASVASGIEEQAAGPSLSVATKTIASSCVAVHNTWL